MTKSKNIPLFLILFLIIVTQVIVSCELFEYHPYETNLRGLDGNLNAKAFKALEKTEEDDDTVTILAMGDTQRFYDEVVDFVTHANTQDADFVILNGDITDFGIKDEYLWVEEIMSGLNKPYLAVIGNHDLSGNGEEIYRKLYGPLNDSFTFNGIKFILLNTNSREYHFDGKVPDIQWLNQQLAADDFDRAVVVSHIPPYDDDFDRSMEHAYVESLQLSGKVDLSLHGHKHKFEEREPYGDGIRYLVSTSMDERMYLKIKICRKGGFKFEKIFY